MTGYVLLGVTCLLLLLFVGLVVWAVRLMRQLLDMCERSIKARDGRAGL